MSIAIIYGDLVAAETLTMDGGTPQSGFPLTNVQDGRLFTQCRGPAADYDWSFQIDFGASDATLSAVALLGLNLSDDGTVRILFDDDAAFTSPIFDTGNMALNTTWAIPGAWEAREGRPFIYLTNDPRSDSSEAAAASWTERYFRAQLVNTTNPPADGHLRAAVLWVGPVFIPTYGASVIAHIDEITDGRVVRTVTVEMTLTQQEEGELRNLHRGLAKMGRVVLQPRTFQAASEIGEAMLCTITDFRSSSSGIRDPLERLRSVSMKFVEAPY